MKSSQIIVLFTAASLSTAFFSCSKQRQSATTAPQQNTGTVQTPYGTLPASRVHQVDDHTIAKMVGGRLQVVDISTGRLVEDLGVPSANDRAGM